MSDPQMRKLIIRPADLSLQPLGPDSAIAGATVSVVYDRPLAVNGLDVMPVALNQAAVGADGVSCDVLCSDDPSITRGDKFGIVVTITAQPYAGTHGHEVTLRRLISITTADPAEVNLGDKADAQPVTQDQIVSVEKAIRDAAAATAAAQSAASVVAGAQAAATAAQSAADKANQVATTMATAQDAAVASLVSTSAGPQTQAALTSGWVTTDRGAAIYNMRQFSGDNPAAQINNAAATLGASGGKAVLQISDDVQLTAPVTWDISKLSLDFTGRTITSKVTGGATFSPTNSQTALTPGNERSLRNLYLVGPGSSSAASVAMSMSSTSANGAIRGINVENVSISGFETGITIGSNAYLLAFTNAHITGCKTGVSMPSGGTNYGENIRFIGGAIGSSGTAVSNANPDGELIFVGTSFDFCPITTIATAGQIQLIGCHQEFAGAASNTVTQPVLQTGSDSSAYIAVIGGKMTADNATYFTPPTLFTTANNNWGGGVHLSDVHMYGMTSTSGYMCGGTGLMRTSNLSTADGNGTGAGGGSVMTATALNRIIDPTFSLSSNADAVITNGTPTTRTTSQNMTITNSGGKLVATKTGGAGASATFRVYIPVRPGRECAAAFTATTTATSGAINYTEGFAACTGWDSNNAPIVAKTSERSGSSWDTSTSQSRSYQGSSTAWSRVAPPWATHFYLSINLYALAASTTTFSQIVLTDR